MLHNGTIKIGDFGMARNLEEPSDPTDIVGTLNYRCPEMILAELSKSRDKFSKLRHLWAVDSWSFACVIFELFNLECFIEGKSLQGVVENMKKRMGSKQSIKLNDLNDDGLTELIQKYN